ncbi:transposable element Tcb1 transposase [Trichonephila clavipes]|nr:transposable element Tcb1 transposase [Trichonephila clavipes]
MSRRKQRSVFDQVSEFDRGRIVAYRDYGLSFSEMGSRVGRNQTTVMRICDRWIQEGTMDRCGRSHPPQCPTSQLSVRKTSIAWSTFDVEPQTPPPPMGGIGYDSQTSLVRIAGTLNSQCYISGMLEPVVLPYLQGLASAIFEQDNVRPHVPRVVQRFLVNLQIELLPWPAQSPVVSPIAAATPDQLWQRVDAVKNSALQAMTKTRALSALISSERVLSTNVLFKSGESRSQSSYAGIGLSCPVRKFTPTDTCRSEDL